MNFRRIHPGIKSTCCLVLIGAFPLMGLSDEPALPSGLADSSTSGSEPALPSGLGGDSETSTTGKDTPSVTESPEAGSLQRFLEDLRWNGFVDSRAGRRMEQSPVHGDTTLAEVRWNFRATGSLGKTSLRMSTDLLYDDVAGSGHIDLKRGQGWTDLRELWILARPFPNADLRLGRQIVTWGTGDLLFLNDLFPKDWVSFFSGRDEDYLKAPVNAARFSWFHDIANLDLVWTPVFQPDRYIDGSRLYIPALQSDAGYRPMDVRIPDDHELALRLHRNFNAWEGALYFYRGLGKSPQQGIGPGTFTFHQLDVYGSSLRGPLIGGIVNLEFAYHDSRDDSRGNNPNIPNNQFRFLLGMDREISRNFNIGLQWYIEHMEDYDSYRRNQPSGMSLVDENRHVLTVRLTRLLKMQTLELSAFAFYSPSDNDAYLRTSATYDWNDHWTSSIGLNYFIGKSESTFFGRFEKNSNAYLSLRYQY